MFYVFMWLIVMLRVLLCCHPRRKKIVNKLPPYMVIWLIDYGLMALSTQSRSCRALKAINHVI